MLFQFSVSFFYDFIHLFNASDYNLPALTTEELKKHYVINIPPNFLHAPEGVALICFTSGLCFALCQLHFLFMHTNIHVWGITSGNYEILVEMTLSAKVVNTPLRVQVL